MRLYFWQSFPMSQTLQSDAFVSWTQSKFAESVAIKSNKVVFEEHISIGQDLSLIISPEVHTIIKFLISGYIGINTFVPYISTPHS